jgi:uncharacterized membrane protein YphA (DoxX/SURF4 family)
MNNLKVPWTYVQKFIFRFVCCLFVIYIFPFPLNFLTYFMYPDSDATPKFLGWYFKIFDTYNNFWHVIIPWVGDHLLHLKNHITIFSNGSGDTTYDYVMLLTFVLLSMTAAVLWSLIDRGRPTYTKAHYWLRVLVRYNLGAFMIIYGFDKVFHLQMPNIGLYQLIQRFGDKSPMGLVWSFISYSSAYSAFAGWGEVIGGTLLFFRRTTTMGTLILVAVLSDVVAINFCYDVPVKLFSSMLLLMDLFLLAPEAGRLWEIFILNKTSSPIVVEFIWSKKRSIRISMAIKWVFILGYFYGNIFFIHKMTRVYGDLTPKPKLYGIYEVQSFIRNKDTVPPLTTDSTRWRQLVVETDKYAVFFFMNDKQKWMRFEVDSTLKKAVLFPGDDTLVKSGFLIRSIDSMHLEMDGTLHSDSLHVLLKKIDPNSFLLVSRGFHWINESPYNR